MTSRTNEGVLLGWTEQLAPGFDDVDAGRVIPRPLLSASGQADSIFNHAAKAIEIEDIEARVN
jgi:hypothetical protein